MASSAHLVRRFWWSVWWSLSPPGPREADAAWATSRLRNDPALPLLQRLKQRAQHGLPRGYIECTADRAVTIGRQRAMAGRVEVAMTASMDIKDEVQVWRTTVGFNSAQDGRDTTPPAQASNAAAAAATNSPDAGG